MSPGRVRVLRGAVASAASTALALAFHVAGGAPVPGAVGVLAPFVLAAFASSLVMTRRPRLLTTLAATSLAQVAFHTLFVLGTPRGTTAGSPLAHAGHLGHGGGLAASTASTTDALAGLGGTDVTPVDLSLHGDARMWLMHGVGALLTALVLQHGELLLRTMLRLAARAVTGLRRPRPAVALLLVTPRAPLPASEPVRLLLQRLTTTAPRRGPPLVLAA